MKRFTVLLAFFAFLGFQALMAQSVQISGNVTSAEDGGPLPGVSVVVKGTTIGTITDARGDYTLSVPQSATAVVFSFIGYETQTVDIGGQTTINVVLQAGTEQLDEVVVTAIGIKRDAKALGYSAVTMNEDDITEARENNLVSGLQGKIAGVQINGSSGEPGSSVSVAIRGYSSITGNEPLYVVDGVPMTNNRVGSSDELNGGFDFGNGANAVNPNDISTMTILKGAAATALYGSRASNGVIIITTKSGQKSTGMGLTYTGSFGVSQILKTPVFQNTFGQGWDAGHYLIENGSWGPMFDGQERVFGNIVNGERMVKPFVPLENNYKDFWDLGHNYQHSLALSGGDDKTTYFFSFSNVNQDGIYPTDADSYNRNTFSLRGTRKVNFLDLSTSLNYTNEKANAVPTGQGLTVVNSAMQIPRDYSMIDGKEYKTNPFYNVDNWYTPYGITNPYYVLDEYGREVNKDKLFGKVQADINLADWVSVTYRFGGDVSTYQYRGWNAITLPAPGSPNYGSSTSDVGQVTTQSDFRYQINHDLLFNFNRDFGADFSVSGVLGLNANESGRNNIAMTVNALDVPGFYNISNSASTPAVTDDNFKRRLIGVFGQAELSYRSFLYLTLTARNDWSSTLPVDNNAYFYPGATLSFVFTELMPESSANVLSFGKLRAAYGQTGKDAGVYLIDPVFIQSAVYNPFRNLNFPINGQNAFEVSNGLGNQQLQPEITTELEFGADLRFLNNRIGIDFAYFDKNTDDQILSLTIPSSTGYTGQTMNLGRVNTNGIELNFSIAPVRTNDFDWNINFAYNKYNSEVVELAEGLDNVFLSGFAGVGLYAKVGEPLGVFMTTPTARTADGRTIVDNGGMPKLDPDLAVIGKADYDYTLGITNGLAYKNLALNFTFDIRQGGMFYSRTSSILYFTGNSIETIYNNRRPFVIPNSVVEVLDVDGNVTGYAENTHPILGGEQDNFYSDGGFNTNETDIRDKSFVKLRNVTFSYTLPKKLFSNLPVQGAQISLVGNNLFVWTPENNTFIDPEISSWGTDIGAKFGEYSGTPSSRTISASIKINF